MRARDGKAGEILGEDHGTRLREGEDRAAMRVRAVSETGRATRAAERGERAERRREAGRAAGRAELGRAGASARAGPR